MELHAIAALSGGNDFQRTSVHVTLKIDQTEKQIRFDLAVLGDIRKPGAPDWTPEVTETGPNYHTSGEFPGGFASPEREERVIVVFTEEVRATLQIRMRSLAKRSEAPGRCDLLFSASPHVEEILMEFSAAPPSGQIDERFISEVGTELREFLLNELRGAIVGAPPAKIEPGRITMTDEQALKMHKAGTLPLRRDQLERLCARLGVQVP